MPRNGSGTYSLPQSAFVPNTTISSAAVNSDFSDIASALTDSLAADGQTSMTGSLKGFAGSAATPGYAFVGDLTTGFYSGGASSGIINVAIEGVQGTVFGSGGITGGGVSATSGITTTSSLTFGGAFGQTIAPSVIAAATYTVLSTDYIIINNYTLGNVTVTLPTAAANTGRILKFVEPGNAVNLISASNNVNYTLHSYTGTTTNILGTNLFVWCEMVSDGTVWRQIAGA